MEWYEELREQYRPEVLKFLLIGESPPDPGAGERRFFYAPTLSRYDNLYRGVALAVYGNRDNFNIQNKMNTLEYLRNDGFWLIDAVENPINKSSRSARRHAIKAAVPSLVQRCEDLAPERGVIICLDPVYQAAAPALRAAGVTLLHSVALPFPLGNVRAEFIEGFRRALEK